VISAQGAESAAIQWWGRSGAAELRDQGWAQIDVDALTDEPPAPAVAWALEAAQAALGVARAQHPLAVGLVTVPLGASKLCVTESPSVDELLATTWTYGPGLEVPGVYVLQPELLDPREQGDVRLPLETSAALSTGVDAYYRCWRSAEDAEHGREYDRTVYLRVNDLT